MAEPNPKRIKMANPIGQSSSSSSSGTSPTDREIEQQLIYPDIQEFDMIKDMPGFVNRTHFIRDFLTKGNRGLAMFAPRRFVKSTHLSMVSQFLQIEADETRGEVPLSAKERKNYKLIQGTRIVSDVNSKEFVDNHLGIQ